MPQQTAAAQTTCVCGEDTKADYDPGLGRRGEGVRGGAAF